MLDEARRRAAPRSAGASTRRRSRSCRRRSSSAAAPASRRGPRRSPPRPPPSRTTRSCRTAAARTASAAARLWSRLQLRLVADVEIERRRQRRQLLLRPRRRHRLGHARQPPPRAQVVQERIDLQRSRRRRRRAHEDRVIDEQHFLQVVGARVERRLAERLLDAASACSTSRYFVERSIGSDTSCCTFDDTCAAMTAFLNPSFFSVTQCSPVMRPVGERRASRRCSARRRRPAPPPAPSESRASRASAFSTSLRTSSTIAKIVGGYLPRSTL